LSLNSAARDLANPNNLKGLLVHEFGHALGLDHSDVAESVMYANPYHDYTYMQTLRTDDIQASTYLYPTSAVRYYDSGILTLPRVEIQPGSSQYAGVTLQLNQAGNFALVSAAPAAYNAQGISGDFENGTLSLPEVDVHNGNTSVKYTGVKLVLRTDMTFSISDGKQAQY
jgi:hypothetical protein